MYVVRINECLGSGVYGTFDYTFDNNEEHKAIEKYESLKEQTFNGRPVYISVQLFKLEADPQEKGIYPIFKPIKKYVNGKWIETKFYKKFMRHF